MCQKSSKLLSNQAAFGRVLVSFLAFRIGRNIGNTFFNFSAKWFGPKKDAKLPVGWDANESLVNEFHQFLMDNKIQFTEAEFAENHKWVKDNLKRQLYITGFNVDASDRVRIEQDPEVTKAVESMPKAQELLDRSKKMVVQRTSPEQRAAQ